MSEQSESPKRRRRQAPPPPPPAGSAIKGAVLVVVAVLIGFVLINDDGSKSVSAAAPGAVTDPGVDPGEPGNVDDPDSSTTSTTTLPLKAESEVKVLVANGTSVAGAAGTTTDDLKARGYVTGTPTNSQNVPATQILYAATYEGEATRLANQLGVAATAVEPLSVPAPVSDMQGANILIVLGPDVASGGG